MPRGSSLDHGELCGSCIGRVSFHVAHAGQLPPFNLVGSFPLQAGLLASARGAARGCRAGAKGRSARIHGFLPRQPLAAMRLKRKQPGELEEEGEEQNEGLRSNAPAAAGAASGSGVVLLGGVSCSAASYRAVRKPFKVRLVACMTVKLRGTVCMLFHPPLDASRRPACPCLPAAAAGVAPGCQWPRPAGGRGDGQLLRCSAGYRLTPGSICHPARMTVLSSAAAAPRAQPGEHVFTTAFSPLHPRRRLE